MREFLAALTANQWTTLLVGCGLLGTGAMFWGLRQLRRLRQLEDTPTSLIRSAAQGYVELRGNARLLPGEPVTAPLSLGRCVWWRYKVERRETVFRNGRTRREWQTLESGESTDLFLLVDHSGECIVDPEGAKVIPSRRQRWYGSVRRPQRGPQAGSWSVFGSYRYTESTIDVGAPLYATGWFRSQMAVTSAGTDREVRDLLSDWKRDRRALLARFDRNRDGQIDTAEWEEVRRAAFAQVEREQRDEPVRPNLHVLSCPPRREPFLLSTHSQEQIIGRLRRQSLFWLPLGALLWVMAGVLLLAGPG